MKYKFGILCVVCLFITTAATAEGLSLTLGQIQGGLVQGKTSPDSKVTLNGTAVAVSDTGIFVIGFGRDAKPIASLVARLPNGKTITRKIYVKQRKYKIERITGLPSRKVSPTKHDITRIIVERDQMRAAHGVISGMTKFSHGFIWPAKGRISGVYGSQRILNGKPRRPHLGVDIAAPEGTPIIAAGDGTVVLVHEDMFFTGKTVLIDHGLGVGTTYTHMSAIDVKLDESVKKGQQIGRIGKTGRATGPHLHWGLTWRGLRLDPALLIGDNPQTAKHNFN